MIKEDDSKFQQVALENSRREGSLLDCAQYCLSLQMGSADQREEKGVNIRGGGENVAKRGNIHKQKMWIFNVYFDSFGDVSYDRYTYGKPVPGHVTMSMCRKYHNPSNCFGGESQAICEKLSQKVGGNSSRD